MNQITVGRSSQSTIVVDARYNTVSGNHATITRSGDVLILQDHSTNGTYVNGVRVHHQSYQIRRGDNVTLGTQYSLNVNEVFSLLGYNGNAVLNRNIATERVPNYNNPQQNQQINIRIGAEGNPNYINEQAPREEPRCLHRWNWGAFYFGWLWGVCNGVYWPLIMLIPFVGQLAALIMVFILGANGNRYAWDNYSGTAEEFDAKQASWSKAAGICILITLIIFTILFILYFSLLISVFANI